MPSPVETLGLEACRDPVHIARWREAMARGTRAARKCGHIDKFSGRQCRNPAMREARAIGIFRCSRHLAGPERIEVDRRGEARLRRWLTSENAIRRRKAEAGLTAASRRRLLEGWKINPELPGRTVAFTPSDERRVGAWLARRGLALDEPLPQTGQLPTPRAQDRLRWIAARHLSGRADDRAAAWELKKITRGDGRWQARKAALFAAGQPLPLPDWPTAGATPKAIIIEPAAPPSKAKKDASVAQLRATRAHRRIAAKTAKTTGAKGAGAAANKTTGAGAADVAPVEKRTTTAPRAIRTRPAPLPTYLSRYSPAYVEILNALRASLDLDRQSEDVQDRIGRAAWHFAHGGMSPEEWAKLRREFRVLCGVDSPAPVRISASGTGARELKQALSDYDPGW